MIDDGGSGVPTRPLLGGLQGAVTKEIEKFDARVLDSKIRALAPDDFRRTAYLNLNATSRVWLSVLVIIIIPTTTTRSRTPSSPKSPPGTSAPRAGLAPR